MKSIFKFAALCVMFTCSLLIVNDIGQVTARNDEMEEALSISMRNTLKASTYSPMYDMNEQDMQAELLRNLVENINTDATYDVQIISASTQGLLDVVLQVNFLHNNGEVGSRILRKTLIVDKTA